MGNIVAIILHQNYTTMKTAANTNILVKLSGLTILILVLLMMNAFGLTAQSTASVKRTASVPMLRLQMSGPLNSLDETVIYYQQGATAGFDADYDAYKLPGPNPAPLIAQVKDSAMIQINGVEPVAQTFSISIKATTNMSGNYNLFATDFGDLPKGTCVYIIDNVTGISQDIINSPYQFSLMDTTTASRFVLSVVFNKIPFTSSVQQLSCNNTNNAKLFAETTDPNTQYDYFWRDSTGSIVKYTFNRFGADSLTNLPQGAYMVEVQPSNGCGYNSTTFTVNPVVIPVASVSLPDTIMFGSGLNTENSNQSLNAVAYGWDFGDNTTESSAFEPSHIYTTPGDFTVALTAISVSGCADTAYHTINVAGFTTGLASNNTGAMKLMTVNDNLYQLELFNQPSSDVNVGIYNLSGQEVVSYNAADFDGKKIGLNLTTYTKGLYLVQVSDQQKFLGYYKLVVK